MAATSPRPELGSLAPERAPAPWSRPKRLGIGFGLGALGVALMQAAVFVWVFGGGERPLALPVGGAVLGLLGVGLGAAVVLDQAVERWRGVPLAVARALEGRLLGPREALEWLGERWAGAYPARAPFAPSAWWIAVACTRKGFPLLIWGDRPRAQGEPPYLFLFVAGEAAGERRKKPGRDAEDARAALSAQGFEVERLEGGLRLSLPPARRAAFERKKIAPALIAAAEAAARLARAEGLRAPK